MNAKFKMQNAKWKTHAAQEDVPAFRAVRLASCILKIRISNFEF